jgi:hypothetical protein
MQINATDELTFQAIQAEIDQCSAVLKDYEVKITEGLQHANEIRNHITALQVEQVRILSTVPSIQGAQL